MAVAAVLGAVGGLVTAMVKLVGTRARLARLEAGMVDVGKALTLLRKRIDRRDMQSRVSAEVESVRSSMTPEHADADDVAELRSEITELRAELAVQRSKLATDAQQIQLALKGIETTTNLILDGKLKLPS